MVTTKTIRNASRRMLLTFLASAGMAGLAVPASAQTGIQNPAIHGVAPSFDPGSVPLAPGERIISASPMPGGAMIQHGGGSYQIIDSSSVPTALDGSIDSSMGGMPMMASPQAYSGFATGGCATGNCGGSYNNGYGGTYGGNACGPVCNPYLYAAADGLYMTNTNVDNYSLSPNSVLRDFDYEFGGRITLGMVPDCRNGIEASAVIPIDWQQTTLDTSAGNALGSFLGFRAPIVAGQLSTFNNARVQSQQYDAEYFSFDINRTLIGWDVIKLLYGIRYVDYEEDYSFRSRLATGQRGLLQSSVQNRMIGGQVGIDMTFPVTCKLWSDFRGRGGLFGNFAESQFQLDNAGATVVRNFDDDIEIAGLIEISSGIRYYFNDDFHLRAGTELWYLGGVATSKDQIPGRIHTTTGRNVDIDDGVLMVGFSLGAELKF